MAHVRGPVSDEPAQCAHLLPLPSWVEIVVKEFLSCPPSELTTVMIATEMPAAISPYSMAVAPDSSFAKRWTTLFIGYSSVTISAERGLPAHLPAAADQG